MDKLKRYSFYIDHEIQPTVGGRQYCLSSDVDALETELTALREKYSTVNPNPQYPDGVACPHPCPHHGCLNHVSHPCEGCGRIAGINPRVMMLDAERVRELADKQVDKWIRDALLRVLRRSELIHDTIKEEGK